jgi:murein hydrolase activator
VRAVHAGRVVYADWFKGYGNVLIIDHGQHYYTVHAHPGGALQTGRRA